MLTHILYLFELVYSFFSYPYLWVKNEFLRVNSNFYISGD
nr:MAG TPA: hypothetical protein [Bacteriophage sp.]